LAKAPKALVVAAVRRRDTLRRIHTLLAEGPHHQETALTLGLGRLHRAIWLNQRYWFTTWRWGKVMAAMLLIGAVLKVTMTA
jgi:hypothetical protein